MLRAFLRGLPRYKYAFDRGFKTSLCCEPMLDNNMGDLISLTSHCRRFDLAREGKYADGAIADEQRDDPTTIAKASRLMRIQTQALSGTLFQV